MIELLISYLVVVFTLMVHVFCYKKCINKPLNTKLYKIIATLILSIGIMLNNMYSSNLVKSLLCFGLIGITFQIWYKEKLYKTFYYAITISIISLFIEFNIISNVFAKIFNCLDSLNQSFLAKTGVTILMGILLYLVVCLIHKALKKFEEIIEKYFSYDILLLIVLIISNLLLTQYGQNYEKYSLYIISICVISLISILIFFLLKSNFTKKQLELKNKFLKESIYNYEIISDEYTELKHNLNADFLAIRSVANKKTQKLLDEKIKKYNKNYSWTIPLEKIPKGLQGIICIKMHEIKKKNLSIEINSKVDKNITDKLGIKNYTILCDAIDIIINNAIEAAIKSKEKAIFININQQNNILEIKVMNTFNSELDIDKIGTKKYTTKENNQGVGLNYINKFNRKNFKIKKEIINNIFIISLNITIKS